MGGLDEALIVYIDLINTITGERERAKMVNRHDAIVALVQRFARRQRISTQAVNIQITPHP